MNAGALAGGLDRLRADRISLVEKRTIMAYARSGGKATDEKAQRQLEAWAELDLLEIVKPLPATAELDGCIRLLNYIRKPGKTLGDLPEVPGVVGMTPGDERGGCEQPSR